MLEKELEFGLLVDKIMVDFLFSELDKRNKTQKDLSEALKLNNPQTITNWKRFLENPEHPKANAIPHKYWFAICKYFNVELMDIISSASKSSHFTSEEIQLILEIRDKNILKYIQDIVKMTSKQ